MNDVIEYLLSGTFIGGLAVKGFDYFLARGTRKNDNHKNLREELTQVWDRIDAQDKLMEEQDRRHAALIVEHRELQQTVVTLSGENMRLKQKLDERELDYLRLEDQNKRLIKDIAQAVKDQAEVELARRRNQEFEDLKEEVIQLRAEVATLTERLSRYEQTEHQA